MRSILYKFVLAPVVMAAAALATTTAAAAATVDIPFSFTVAGQDCPAGVYSVQRQTTGNLVILQSKDASRTFSWLLAPGDPAPTSTAVTLKFNESGTERTLRTVQYGGLITSRLDKKDKHTEHAHTRIIQGE
jgi:hypothetical protein